MVCVSESTKRDFKRHFPAYESGPIEVIYHGVEDRFAPGDPAAQAGRTQIEYVLFVGRRDEYKNFWCVAKQSPARRVCGS